MSTEASRNTPTGAGWAGQLYTYVESTGVYKCPDDSTSLGVTTNGYQAQPVSDALNKNLRGGGSGGSLPAEQAPASTGLLTENQNVTSFFSASTDEGYTTAGITATNLPPAVDGLDRADTDTAAVPADEFISRRGWRLAAGWGLLDASLQAVLQSCHDGSSV